MGPYGRRHNVEDSRLIFLNRFCFLIIREN